MQRRDGHPADPEDIYLTGGASPAVQNSLLALIRDENHRYLCTHPTVPAVLSRNRYEWWLPGRLLPG
ncbi:Alanine aminotransferase 1 [Phytophthora citrophthora]|uniref:Alanine aminotransferase 1 n=1 Tax=Phytophthora citrophthora TaxID=4793 RepID=A0AAD9LHY7_9STRA|nr:Alanine aminotransferase 1 [Phytophthora citrophthora]KAK1936996.1 Alanine aminotransferase 1 [Phytophthora citrophthora]KAK1938757.1 Alanine aminotransferase 1 [Phytophthora citrophthora]KAK1948109.1 Alanine aminotransferase 1 [Phytophthora citrophthora]